MTALRHRSQPPETADRAVRQRPGKKRARADSNAHPVSAMRKNSPLRSAKGRTTVATAPPPAKADLLWLNDYLPYRMAVVAARMLREAGRVYKRRRDPLNTPQWRVLGILANHEPLTASEISKISMLDKVAMSRTLAEMVRRGFVTRRRTRRDRRELEVTLTREGWRYYRALVPDLRRQEQFLRSVLDKGEIEGLFSIFERFEALFGELDERRRRYGDDVEIESSGRRMRGNGSA
jgi:DNA-binding MarR family transcriptional regulator